MADGLFGTPTHWDDLEWARERILEQLGSTAQAAVEDFGCTREELHREIDEAVDVIEEMTHG